MLPRHIYVHVPFCARRCSYCDFSIAVRRVVPVNEYIDALIREIDVRFSHQGEWIADTLYFGGGTPSILGPGGVTRIMDRLRARITLAPGTEVTLEANPEDVTLESARSWRASGVTRLSVGGQSFDDRVLAWMHRTHRADHISRALEDARAAGLRNISLDLIFALPKEMNRDWERDLEQALALSPTHLSFYGLTIEPATPLGRWRDRGAVREAPEECYEREFLQAHQRLTAAGFEHYEVSNYALPGERARHNSSYWERVPYAGVGPSAHSFDGTQRRWNIAAYAAWLRAVQNDRDPLAGQEVLSKEDVVAERTYLGLRTTGGLELDPSLDDHVIPWINAGWASYANRYLRLTPLGWLRLDALAAHLTIVGSRY